MMKTLIACTFAAVAIAAPKAENNEAWTDAEIVSNIVSHYGGNSWSFAVGN